MTKIEQPCPVCGAELEFDEVDVGVGVIRGNYNCPQCGWHPKPLTVEDDDLEDDLPRNDSTDDSLDEDKD